MQWSVGIHGYNVECVHFSFATLKIECYNRVWHYSDESYSCNENDILVSALKIVRAWIVSWANLWVFC